MIASSSTKMPRSASAHSLRLSRWGNGAGVFLLIGYLIFCHGCHGEDVDDELCVPPPAVREMQKTSEVSRDAQRDRVRAPLGVAANLGSDFTAVLP
jgi:hypothetical protein